MRFSHSVKGLLKVLPVLAVLAATGIGVWIGNEIYPSSPEGFLTLDQQYVQLQPGTAGTCASPLIYTSLPPKCKTSEGTYIPLPGTSYLFVMPGRK